MSNKPELIAEQLMTANINKKTWGDLVSNVRSNGAKGDGIADDTAAIQKTIDDAPVGATIVFPTGTYRFSTVSISKKLYLDGKGSTLNCESSLNIIGINVTAEYFYARDLTLLSTGSKTDGKATIGIKHSKAGGGSFTYLDNVSVQKFSLHGILLHDSIASNIKNCIIAYNTNGLSILTKDWPSNTTLYLENSYFSVNDKGINSNSLFRAMLNNTICEYNTYGMYVTSGEVTIIRPYFEQNVTNGAYLRNTYATIITPFSWGAGDTISQTFDPGVFDFSTHAQMIIDSFGKATLKEIELVGNMQGTYKKIKSGINGTDGSIEGLLYDNRPIVQAQAAGTKNVYTANCVIDNDHLVQYGTNYTFTRVSAGVYDILFGRELDAPHVSVDPYDTNTATWTAKESGAGNWNTFRLANGIRITHKNSGGAAADGYISVTVTSYQP